MFKKIGIVGGLGWRSTVDYYRALEERAAQWTGPGPEYKAEEGLEISIESLDLPLARSLLYDGQHNGRWEGFDNYHRAALIRLERSEAEVAVIACNTPHERLPAIALGTRIRIVDLFEAMSAEAARRGAQRVVILGTLETMNSARLHRLLTGYGIEPVVPLSDLAAHLQELIGELQSGVAADARERLAMIARSSLGEVRAHDFVGLNCTELPLALPECRLVPVTECQGMSFLNASIIHVDVALDVARGPHSAAFELEPVVKRKIWRIAR